MAARFPVWIIYAILVAGIISCKKSNDTTAGTVIPPGFKLSYGDSVFYLQNQSSDYIIRPQSAPAGQYSGFPEGIDIDAASGAINVSKTETGLRYRISFTPTGTTDTFYTMILVSGINYLDGFYRLNTADSMLKPLYNASTANAIPGANASSVFDEGSNCNGAGCTVNTGNGEINLAQTVRNGVFGTTPSNNDRHEFLLNYRISDKSNKALNALKVKLYYFDSISDVTQEVYDIISSRQGTILQANRNVNPLETFSAFGIDRATAVQKAAKPRPPCIFILSR